MDSKSLYYLNQKFQATSHLHWLYGPVVSDLDGNPKDRFCHDAAYILCRLSHQLYLSSTLCLLFRKISSEMNVYRGSHAVNQIKCVFDNDRVIIMPPTLKKWGGILVSACPYVCMYVCTYVCMYSCSRYRLETSCMDSSWKNSRRIFLVFPELSPLVKLRPFDKQGDEIL